MKQLLLVPFAALSVGCGWPSGDAVDSETAAGTTKLVERRGTLVVDGCALDPWQAATVARPETRRVIQEIVLLCLVPRKNGEIGPSDESARVELGKQIAALHPSYRVSLGVSFTDGTGDRYDGAQTASFLADSSFRDRLAVELVPLATMADGIELDLQKLPPSSASDVVTLVDGVAKAIRPQRKLGLFVPPLLGDGSDPPEWSSFRLASLASRVDRLRAMTLDFSDHAPGPTTDPGWTVDVARKVRALAGSSVALDVAYPLYGTDFSPAPRSITFLEAMGIASSRGLTVQRGPTGAPHLSWTDTAGVAHESWFDDASSTLRALRAFDVETLPPSVGLVFYGLGAEDPALFPALAEAMP
ncbi:MAG: hypothetical protein ACXVEF_11505 [Polyangiales bacterium]